MLVNMLNFLPFSMTYDFLLERASFVRIQGLLVHCENPVYRFEQIFVHLHHKSGQIIANTETVVILLDYLPLAR